MSSKIKISNGVRDLILYVVIGIAVVVAIVWLSDYNLEHHIDRARQWRYLAAGIFTCFVFGFLVSNNRRLWRAPKVWVLWAVFLAAHLLGWGHYVLVQTRPVAIYAIIAVVEAYVFTVLTAFVMGAQPLS